MDSIPTSCRGLAHDLFGAEIKFRSYTVLVLILQTHATSIPCDFNWVNVKKDSTQVEFRNGVAVMAGVIRVPSARILSLPGVRIGCLRKRTRTELRCRETVPKYHASHKQFTSSWTTDDLFLFPRPCICPATFGTCTNLSGTGWHFPQAGLILPNFCCLDLVCLI